MTRDVGVGFLRVPASHGNSYRLAVSYGVACKLVCFNWSVQ